MGNTFSCNSPNGVIDINARGRGNGLMYFHRDLNEEQNHSAPRLDILRLPESDSSDLFEDCAPLIQFPIVQIPLI